MNRIRGFSLIELMVVMVITAMIGLISVQGWQRWQQHQQLLQSARTIQHYLMRLRLEAHWHNQARVVQFHLLQNHAGCLTVDSFTVCEKASHHSLIITEPQVVVESITEGLGFYGRENVARPGRIVIRNPSGRAHVIVSSRGRVRICQQNAIPCQ